MVEGNPPLPPGGNETLALRAVRQAEESVDIGDQSGFAGRLSLEELALKREFLWKVHGYTNDYIRFADAKAGFCVGIVTALLGVLFASKSQDVFFHVTICQWNFAVWASALAFLFLTVSIIAAGIVILPRLWTHAHRGFVFWGSIALFPTQEKFRQEFDAVKPTDLNDLISAHLFSLAKVCRRKYTWLYISISAAAIGGCFSILFAMFKTQAPAP